jgi:RNA 2',3'-cyclic 3'-phosphodiesterase
MRLFLALNLPERMRRELWEATREVRDAGPTIKWVPEARLHVTLKFIGEQPDTALGPLIDATNGIAASHAAPMIDVGGIGAFPTFRRPRVVWMGIEPDPRLELLHHDVEVACERLGYEIEGRPFRPHVTLGRVHAPIAADELRAVRIAAKKVRFSDAFQPATIDMMQSTPSTNGAPYAMLAAAPMRVR